MRTFAEIARDGEVNDLLKESGKYLAHSPEETLSDHMKLVTHYFQALVSTHGLEPLIDRLLLKQWSQSSELADIVKGLFWNAILYHDFGKVNENFQIKLGNPLFSQVKKNGIDTQHSILSAFIYLVHQISDLGDREKQIGQEAVFRLIPCVFALAHNIVRHHSSRMDDFSVNQTFKGLGSDSCTVLTDYLSRYHKEVNPQIIRNIPVLWSQWVKFESLGFEWFASLRLNFSLLTAADYYATSHYCNKWSANYDSFGVLDSEMRNRHFESIQSSQPHNEKLYREEWEIIGQLPHDCEEKSNANLNKLRSRMAAEVIENTRQNSSKRLFYIEAPTGGGKTNMAFLATQELLRANLELNKVFYVFPFTTLVTQTKKAAIETLELEENEWIELHGRAPWKQKASAEEREDGLYGENRLDDIHNQFVNYPYTFLSHVRFFDILKANDKSSIYLMHRLANSVVVIDEVQAYNPMLWDKMAYLLKEYSEAFNIRFVVMSATLPKIGSLVNAEFCYLLPDAIDRFFTNPNFSDRVSFSGELLSRPKPEGKEAREDYLSWLLEMVHEKSEAYRARHGQVRTIIEFIFKKSATEFATLAKNVFHGYEIQVLSGTILEPRRREVIRDLKHKDNQKKNVLLITTQVVEAGVDIDMDLGFKNRSIVDSEEQLAGRVNRNVKKEDCVVYLFDLDDASLIYKKDLRYQHTRQGLSEEYFEILRTKSFDRLYEKVKSWLDRSNQESGIRGTALCYEKSLVGQLNFPGIDREFVLIDNANTSVFVPLELPLADFEQVVTKQQLEFLAGFGVCPADAMLSGRQVFDLYKRLITDNATDFSEKRRNLKILQSIMSLYTFSLFSKSTLVEELVAGGNREEFGYLYLVSHKDLYDYKMGLLDRRLKELIFI